MNKFVLAGLLALAGWCASSAHGQFFVRPSTTPPTRPFSTDPRVQLYGPQQSIYGLFPQGVPPAGAVSAFGSAYTTPTQGQTSQSTGVDPGSPSITGHPTRFNAYAGYFNNQGGGASMAPSPTNQSSRTPSATFGGGTAGRPTSTPNSGAKSPTTPPTRR